MENTFDFNQVGKRMPYKVPDAFFDKMMESLPNPTEGGANLRFQKPLLRGSWGMGGSSPLLRRGWGGLPSFCQKRRRAPCMASVCLPD